MDTSFLQFFASLLIITPMYIYVKITKQATQATNFIATASRKMNESFKLPTKHDMLQYMVHVFTWHPFPSFPE
jgi:hypothetical protein